MIKNSVLSTKELTITGKNYTSQEFANDIRDFREELVKANIDPNEIIVNIEVDKLDIKYTLAVYLQPVEQDSIAEINVSCKTIPMDTFAGLKNVKRINFKTGCKTIYRCMSKCNSIKQITFDDTVKSIYGSQFRNNDKMKIDSIVIRSSIVTKSNCNSGISFANCVVDKLYILEQITDHYYWWDLLPAKVNKICLKTKTGEFKYYYCEGFVHGELAYKAQHDFDFEEITKEQFDSATVSIEDVFKSDPPVIVTKPVEPKVKEKKVHDLSIEELMEKLGGE